MSEEFAVSEAQAESETDTEIVGETFLFVHTDDEKLRCFIFMEMADADIDGKILVQNMDLCFQWIKGGGEVPQGKHKGHKQ